MKKLVLFFFILLSVNLFGQEEKDVKKERKPIERGGFIFGIAFGRALTFSSSSSTNTSGPSVSSTSFTLSSANMNVKFGVMAKRNLAMLILLPATQYSGGFNGRALRGVIPAVQYFMDNRTWLQAGAGVGLETATVFQMLQSNLAHRTLVGPSIYLAVGYDLRLSNTIAMDVQARFQYAKLSEQAFNINKNVFTLGVLLGLTAY